MGPGTAQRPLGPGFGARTTAAEVVGQDLRGRTAVVALADRILSSAERLWQVGEPMTGARLP